MKDVKFTADDYNNEVIEAINEIGSQQLAEEYRQVVVCITGELAELLNTDFLNMKNPLSWDAYKRLRRNNIFHEEIKGTVREMIQYQKLEKYKDCVKTLVNWIALSRKRKAGVL